MVSSMVQVGSLPDERMIGLRVLLFNRAIARVGRSRLDYQARTAVRGLEGVMTLKKSSKYS